jgi:hypothetical protein
MINKKLACNLVGTYLTRDSTKFNFFVCTIHKETMFTLFISIIICLIFNRSHQAEQTLLKTVSNITTTTIRARPVCHTA